MSIKKGRPNKGNRGRVPVHSESFKVQVVLEYLDGGYSYSQVADRNELSKGQVANFVSWYRKHQTALIMVEVPEVLEEGSSKEDPTKELEKKLALAEMKIAALEKVIALANEAYGTDLKKKAVTR